jgi:hypothetical protein
MKQLSLILLLGFTFLKAYPGKIDGYIVTLNNDTVQVQIKGFHESYTHIKIVDSTGTTQVLTPKEIKAYGYTFKLQDYVFRAKPIKDGSLYFLEMVTTGDKTSLYEYSLTVVRPQVSSVEVFYTFEKADGSYLFLKNFDALDTLNSAIKSFYSDNQEVQRLVDNKFQARRKIQKDIKDLVDAVNNS